MPDETRTEYLHLIFGGTVGISAGKSYRLEGLSPFTSGYPRYARQFVCPWCCRVWAVLATKSEIGSKEYFRPEAVSCLDCLSTYGIFTVPGSLLHYTISGDQVDWELLEHLPKDLLTREFNLHMEHLWPSLQQSLNAVSIGSEIVSLAVSKSKIDNLLESL